MSWKNVADFLSKCVNELMGRWVNALMVNADF